MLRFELASRSLLCVAQDCMLIWQGKWVDHLAMR